MGQSIYREAWLHKAIKALTPMFAEKGINLPPKVQVSCGFPGGGSARKRIGECWNTNAAGDGVNHIFISPRLEQPVIVLATLIHELIHAADNCENGHKAPFKSMAVAMGLEGKMTATVPGDELIETLKGVAEKLGDYPHKALSADVAGKKQTTRMLKAVCIAGGSDYKVRLTRKMVDEYGFPKCPCHDETMEFGE